MDVGPHILVVDDEPPIRSLLRIGLESEGFTVSEAANRGSLFERLHDDRVDLITLELNLAGDDGLAIAQIVRKARNVPIVMITGRATPADRIRGLENGAEDYITKPFTVREVALRIRNILGRYSAGLEGQNGSQGPADSSPYKLDFGVLDPQRRDLFSLAGEEIRLTSAEFELLEIFVRQPNRILSRSELMLLLRGREWSPLERTLDKFVAQLRGKIETPGEPPRFIKSVRNVGYVYTGQVEKLPYDVTEHSEVASMPRVP